MDIKAEHENGLVESFLDNALVEGRNNDDVSQPLNGKEMSVGCYCDGNLRTGEHLAR